MLQAIRHLVAAAVGIAAAWLAEALGIPLSALGPEWQAGTVTGIYAIIEKTLKRLWPSSAGV